MTQVKSRENIRVEFVKEPVEDRAASMEQGTLIMRDEDVIRIHVIGGQNALVIEHRKSDRPEKFKEFDKEYQAWLANEELPVEGTPLKTWNMISPAQLRNCLNLKIRTVEELAVLNEQGILALGMGGRRLVQQAIDWLSASTAPAKIARQMEELQANNDKKDQDIEDLKQANITLSEQMKAMQALMGQAIAAPAPASPAKGKA